MSRSRLMAKRRPRPCRLLFPSIITLEIWGLLRQWSALTFAKAGVSVDGKRGQPKVGLLLILHRVILTWARRLRVRREGRLNPIGSVDPAWMSDVAQAAEQLGYYSLWLNEFLETEPNVRVRFDDPPNYYDALTTLGYLAAQTRRIRFLPSVLVLPLHHPILLNRQAATLDVLSGGRLTIGVGLGGWREDYRRLRVELGAVNRGQMMDEFVQALQALWSEQKASFSGRF